MSVPGKGNEKIFQCLIWEKKEERKTAQAKQLNIPNKLNIRKKTNVNRNYMWFQENELLVGMHVFQWKVNLFLSPNLIQHEA